MYLLGIDVGTQGTRALLCDPQGDVHCQATHPFEARVPTGESDWFEQCPGDWWDATVTCLRQISTDMAEQGLAKEAIAGISVTSTSGTLCFLDEQNKPLGNALMYNDRRAQANAQQVNEAGQTLATKMGYRFSASFSLPKMVWAKEKDTPRFEATSQFASPTGWIIGQLTGRFGVSDYTNALKMGFDLIEGKWPRFIEAELSIPLNRLPQVVAPGTQVGQVSTRSAEHTGLAVGTPVLAGMTDGCASQISTGAVAPGQWNSTLGTTLVIKGVSRQLVRDPLGRIYCHRHPDGHWLPGGASNIGGECLSRFPRNRWDDLNQLALYHTPTDVIIYPLKGRGERFPFSDPQAESFILGNPSSEAELYAAYLEGVAYVERLAYETLDELGAPLSEAIYAAGGGTKSQAWSQIRADILGKTLRIPAVSGGAMGAAIVAASGTTYDGIVPAAESMVRITETYEPRNSVSEAYTNRYRRFRNACRERGYIY